MHEANIHSWLETSTNGIRSSREKERVIESNPSTMVGNEYTNDSAVSILWINCVELYLFLWSPPCLGTAKKTILSIYSHTWTIDIYLIMILSKDSHTEKWTEKRRRFDNQSWSLANWPRMPSTVIFLFPIE